MESFFQNPKQPPQHWRKVLVFSVFVFSLFWSGNVVGQDYDKITETVTFGNMFLNSSPRDECANVFPCGKHEGDDYYAEDWNIGGGDDDLGEPLILPFDAELIFKGFLQGKFNTYGNTVVLKSKSIFTDNDGTQFYFLLRVAHLNEITLCDGNLISKGSYIGTVGKSKGFANAHLHVAGYQIPVNEWNTMKGRLSKGSTPQDLQGDATKYSIKIDMTTGYIPTTTGTPCNVINLSTGDIYKSTQALNLRNEHLEPQTPRVMTNTASTYTPIEIIDGDYELRLLEVGGTFYHYINVSVEHDGEVQTGWVAYEYLSLVEQNDSDSNDDGTTGDNTGGDDVNTDNGNIGTSDNCYEVKALVAYYESYNATTETFSDKIETTNVKGLQVGDKLEQVSSEPLCSRCVEGDNKTRRYHFKVISAKNIPTGTDVYTAKSVGNATYIKSCGSQISMISLDKTIVGTGQKLNVAFKYCGTESGFNYSLGGETLTGTTQEVCELTDGSALINTILHIPDDMSKGTYSLQISANDTQASVNVRIASQSFCDVNKNEWFFGFVEEIGERYKVETLYNGVKRNEDVSITQGYPNKKCNDADNSDGIISCIYAPNETMWEFGPCHYVETKQMTTFCGRLAKIKQLARKQVSFIPLQGGDITLDEGATGYDELNTWYYEFQAKRYIPAIREDGLGLCSDIFGHYSLCAETYINRQETMMMIGKSIFELEGDIIVNWFESDEGQLFYQKRKYDDDDKIASQAQPYVYWATYHGIIQGGKDDDGNTNFSPKDKLTRGQISKIIVNTNRVFDSKLVYSLGHSEPNISVDKFVLESPSLCSNIESNQEITILATTGCKTQSEGARVEEVYFDVMWEIKGAEVIRHDSKNITIRTPATGDVEIRATVIDSEYNHIVRIINFSVDSTIYIPPSITPKIFSVSGSNENVNGVTDFGLQVCADTTFADFTMSLQTEDGTELGGKELSFVSAGEQLTVHASSNLNLEGSQKIFADYVFYANGNVHSNRIELAELDFNSFKNEFEARLKLMQADAKKSGNQVLTEEEFYEMARRFAPIPVSIAQQRLTLDNPNAELTLSRTYAILKALYGDKLTLKPLSGSQKVTADMGAFYVTESFRNHQGTYEFATEYDKNLADIQVTTDCETKFIKGETFDLNLSGISSSDKLYISSEEIEIKEISSDKLTLLANEVGMKPITVYVFRNGKYTAKTFFLNIENPSGTDITNNREIPVLDMADMQFWTALDSAGKIADNKGHCILYISKDIQVTGSVRVPNGVFLVGSTQNGECITFELDGNLIFEDNTKKGGISNIIIKSANGNGILIKNSNRIFVGASTVDNSRSHGISVINSNDIWIMNNNITNNTGYGIRVDANSEANIFSNIISGNGGDNIYSLSTSSMIGFNPEITLTGSTALERHNEKHPDAIDAGYPNDTYRDADGSIIDAGAENYCNLWKKWYHRGSGSRPTPTLDLKDFPENYTLQQAIDMADKVRKDINSDLIRLLITPDTYDENVTVPAGVWLRGKTGLASDVVINGVNSGIPTVKLYGNSLETRFDGIMVIGTISVENNGLLTIYKSDIQGNINQTGSDELILINNKIHSSNTDGISANGTVTLINNEISNHAGKDISGTDFTAEFNIVHGNTINILAGLETNLETSNISDGIQAGHYRYLDENNQRSSIGLSGGYKFDWRKTNGQKPKTPKAVLVRKEGKLLLRWSQISDNTDITYKVKTANGNITLFETNNTEVEIPYEPDMVFEFYVEAINEYGHSSKSEIVRKVTDLDLGKGNDLVLVSSETEILDEDTTIHAGEYLPLKVGILNPTSLPSGSFYIFIRTIDYDVSKSGQLIDSIYVANVNPNETLVLEQNIKTSATLSASTKAISIQLAPDGTDNNKLRRDLKVLSPKNGRVEYDISTTIKAYPNPTRGKVVLVDSNNPFTSKDQFKVILMSGKLLNLEPRRIGNEVHFDFSGKPAGMYFIQIIRNDKLYQTMKIVKQ